MARVRISRFPIDLRRRPYNTLALPCECVTDNRIFDLVLVNVNKGFSFCFSFNMCSSWLIKSSLALYKCIVFLCFRMPTLHFY